jgi:periplasmic divalent cation tolerance protein
MIALSTCPDESSAASIAAALVKEGLATCVNRIGAVHSTYVWDGRLHDEPEILLLMKTTAERLPALDARLKELHPYELPELVALPVAGGNERYLDWVRSGVRSAAANPDPGQT